MQKLIMPKTQADIDLPLIFLAGPIRSAPKWHDIAADMIFYKCPDIAVASPSRELFDPALEHYLVHSNNNFPRSRAWELHYLEHAARGKNGGVIMFWLPKEENHNCGKSYGAMTRMELGETLREYAHDKKYRFCIGSDGEFSELHTIAYDLQHFAPDKQDYLKIGNGEIICKCPTLEDTCEEAIKIALSK